MGHRNVERVLLATPALDLPPATWRCLAVMALRAHDDTHLYFAGHEWLAMRLGYPPGQNGLRLVRRHLHLLEHAGYVKATARRRGRNWEYKLDLPG